MASEATTSRIYNRISISNEHLDIQDGSTDLPAWDSLYNPSLTPSNTLYDSATSLLKRRYSEEDSNSSPSPRFSPTLSTSGARLHTHPYPANALSPRSRAVWQLSQSEPSLVLDSQEDALDDAEDDEEDEKHRPESPTAANRKVPMKRRRRRNTLHLEIPVRKVTRTREVEDEEPVLTLGDSSMETEKPEDEERIIGQSEDEREGMLLSASGNDDTIVIVDHDADPMEEQRGRSHLRGVRFSFWREGRASSLPPPPMSPASKEKGQSMDLRPPIHIACIARRGSECPHGTQCPYVRLDSTDPSSRPPPPKLSARLPPISYDEAVHPSSTSPLLTSTTVVINSRREGRNAETETEEEEEEAERGQREEKEIESGIQNLRLHSPSLSPSPSASPSPDPIRSRPPQVVPLGSTASSTGWSIRRNENGDWISVKNPVREAPSATTVVSSATTTTSIVVPPPSETIVSRDEARTNASSSFPTSTFSFSRPAPSSSSNGGGGRLNLLELLKSSDPLVLDGWTHDPWSYPRHKIRRVVGGHGSRKSRGGSSELESEEEDEAVRRKRRRRSSVSSLSGKYAVPVIPPYRGGKASANGNSADEGDSNSSVKATATMTPEKKKMTDAGEPTPPKVATGESPISTSSSKSEGQRSEGRSRPKQQLQLSSPPTSPDLSSKEIKRRPGENLALSSGVGRPYISSTSQSTPASVLDLDGHSIVPDRRPTVNKVAPSRSLFGLEIAAIGREAAAALPVGERKETKKVADVSVGTSGSAKGLFSNLYRAPLNPLVGKQRERRQSSEEGVTSTHSSSSTGQRANIASPLSAVQPSSPDVTSPVSPSSATPSTSTARHAKSPSASSTATSDTIGSTLKPGSSALQRAIDVMASQDPERFARLEAERIRIDQKHQQAQRLEKALEAKRTLYLQQLLGMPVSFQGEEPTAVNLTTEERERAENEVENVEASLLDVRNEIRGFGGIPGRSVPWKECRSHAALEVVRSPYTSSSSKVSVPSNSSVTTERPGNGGPEGVEGNARMDGAKERVMAAMSIFGGSIARDRDSLPPFVLNSMPSQRDRMQHLLNPSDQEQRRSMGQARPKESRRGQGESTTALGLPFMGTLLPGTLGRPASALKAPSTGIRYNSKSSSKALENFFVGTLPSAVEEAPKWNHATSKTPMDGLNLLRLIQGHTRQHLDEQEQATREVGDEPKQPHVVDQTPATRKELSVTEQRTSTEMANPGSSSSRSFDKATTLPIDDTKAKRRISMSNALPGEEASSQTMEGLAFDSDEEDADDSREYISAEEGFIEESDHEHDEAPVTSSTPQPPEPSIAVEPSSRPVLQRKRSLTTTDLPPPQAQLGHRPSVLDDWTFNFAPRKPKVAAGAASPRTRAGAPLTHLRKLSHESSVASPFRAQGSSIPQDTPDSPPPRRPSPSSLRIDRFSSLADPPMTQDGHGSLEEERIAEGYNDVHPSFKSAYHVVTSSANVLDEATNIIEYATARVMSGGVKIGSIAPRGQNGVIEEEDEEDMEEMFETVETFENASVSNNVATAQGQFVSHPQTQPVVPGGAYPVQPVSTVPNSKLVPTTTSTVISSAQSNVPGQPPTVIIQKRTVVANSSPGIQSYTNSGSPVTSGNGGQSTPIEYCGDFRTTGHCRFGARCRYSHDIEPRVKSMNTGTTIKYRPILRSDPSTHPPNPEMLNPLPPLPAGYQISNIMPQPHHIPGVPLAQQPSSPFVFSTPAAVAHPKTAPAATAAAARGELMADKERAAKILKSMGLSPHQTVPHQPAPVVLADGEISYNLNKGRSGIFHDVSKPFSTQHKPSKYAPYIQTKDAETEARETQEMLIARFGPGAAPRTQAPPSEGDSSSVNLADEEEDVWHVSSERQRQAVDASRQITESSSHSAQPESHHPLEEQQRVYTPAQPPPSYSSAQVAMYPMTGPQHPQPVQYPQPISHPPPPVAAYPPVHQPVSKQSIAVSPEYLAALLTAAQQGMANSTSHRRSQVAYAPQSAVYGSTVMPQTQAVPQHPQHVAYHPHPQHQPSYPYQAAVQGHVLPQQPQPVPNQHPPHMQYPAGTYTNMHPMPF